MINAELIYELIRGKQEDFDKLIDSYNPDKLKEFSKFIWVFFDKHYVDLETEFVKGSFKIPEQFKLLIAKYLKKDVRLIGMQQVYEWACQCFGGVDKLVGISYKEVTIK